MDFDGQFIGNDNTTFNLKTAYRFWLGEKKNSSLAVELWFSQFPSLQLNFRYHPFGGHFSVETNGYVMQTQNFFFNNETVEALYVHQRFGGNIQIKQPLFKRLELTMGISGEYSRSNHQAGIVLFSQENWDQYTASASLVFDTLDRVITPTEGLRIEVRFDEAISSAKKPFTQLKMAGEYYLSATHRFIISPLIEAHTLIDGPYHYVQLPALGRVFVIQGFSPQEIRAENVALFGLQLRYQMASLPFGIGDELYLQLAPNVAISLDNSATETFKNLKHFIGGSLGIVANTILGELQFSVGFSDAHLLTAYLGLKTTRVFY